MLSDGLHSWGTLLKISERYQFYYAHNMEQRTSKWQCEEHKGCTSSRGMDMMIQLKCNERNKNNNCVPWICATYQKNTNKFSLHKT